MTEYDYIEALGGGRFINLPVPFTSTITVEFTFMTTGYPDQDATGEGHFFNMGQSFGGAIVLSTWAGGDTKQMFWDYAGDFNISAWWTLNEEHTVVWSPSQYSFDGHTQAISGGNVSGSNVLSINSSDAGVRIVKVKITDGGSTVCEFVGAEDNGTVGLLEKVSNVFYAPASGTWSTGSYDNFEADKYEVDFTYAGGTDTITVSADYAWTCNTPTDFTLSPTSGNAGTTTVTVTAGTTTTAKSETVTFTDSETNTFDISITQTGDDAMVPFKKIIRGTRRIN